MSDNKNIQLKSYNEKNGQFVSDIYPITKSEIVMFNNGDNLEDVITTTSLEIDQVSQKLNEHIENSNNSSNVEMTKRKYIGNEFTINGSIDSTIENLKINGDSKIINNNICFVGEPIDNKFKISIQSNNIDNTESSEINILLDEPLRKHNNVNDKIYEKNGEVVLEKNILCENQGINKDSISIDSELTDILLVINENDGTNLFDGSNVPMSVDPSIDRRYINSLVSYNNKIYMLGWNNLQTFGDGIYLLEDIHNSKQWTKLLTYDETIPSMMYSKTHIWKNKAYVIGMFDPFNWTSIEDMVVYDFEANTIEVVNIGLTNISRCTVTSDNNYLYIFGGTDIINDCEYGHVYRYSVENGIEQLATMPNPLVEFDAYVYNEKIYCIGGSYWDYNSSNGGYYSNDGLIVYDINSNQWETITLDQPIENDFFEPIFSFMVNDELYVISNIYSIEPYGDMRSSFSTTKKPYNLPTTLSLDSSSKPTLFKYNIATNTITSEQLNTRDKFVFAEISFALNYQLNIENKIYLIGGVLYDGDYLENNSNGSAPQRSNEPYSLTSCYVVNVNSSGNYNILSEPIITTISDVENLSLQTFNGLTEFKCMSGDVKPLFEFEVERVSNTDINEVYTKDEINFKLNNIDNDDSITIDEVKKISDKAIAPLNLKIQNIETKHNNDINDINDRLEGSDEYFLTKINNINLNIENNLVTNEKLENHIPKQLVIQSPSGIQYKIIVDDDGNLCTTEFGPGIKGTYELEYKLKEDITSTAGMIDSPALCNFYEDFDEVEQVSINKLNARDNRLSYVFKLKDGTTSTNLNTQSRYVDTVYVKYDSSIKAISMSSFATEVKYMDTSELKYFNCSNVNSNGNGYTVFSLKSINTASFDLSKLVSMKNMFYGCQSLTNLNLKRFTNSIVTNLDGAFGYCKALKDLDLSQVNMENVISMNNTFTYCENLTNLKLDLTTAINLTSMNNTFSSCGLTEIDLSSLQSEKIVSMVGTFKFCKKLTNLNLDNIKTSLVVDMNNIFYDCAELKTLDLSSFDTSSCQNMNKMFYGCSGLTNLNISSFRTPACTDMGDMFRGCSNLTSLDITLFDTSNVTNIGGMFYSCTLLTELDLSNFNTQKCTSMTYLFYKCGNLQSLNIGSFNTQLVTNMGNMFNGCELLTSLDVSSFNTENVTNMSYMFYNLNKINTLRLVNFVFKEDVNLNNMLYLCNANVYVKSEYSSVVTEATTKSNGKIYYN